MADAARSRLVTRRLRARRLGSRNGDLGDGLNVRGRRAEGHSCDRPAVAVRPSRGPPLGPQEQARSVLGALIRDRDMPTSGPSAAGPPKSVRSSLEEDSTLWGSAAVPCVAITFDIGAVPSGTVRAG
ncbi:hypothetical protein CDD83_10807 [Cordyceps sp. RAO-2017]|nr:hypothetical protein CDD83_10807 [Cordyceps sp. RAO-2017]